MKAPDRALTVLVVFRVCEVLTLEAMYSRCACGSVIWRARLGRDAQSLRLRFCNLGTLTLTGLHSRFRSELAGLTEVFLQKLTERPLLAVSSFLQFDFSLSFHLSYLNGSCCRVFLTGLKLFANQLDGDLVDYAKGPPATIRRYQCSNSRRHSLVLLN